MKRFKIIADSTIPYLRGILEPFTTISYLPAKEFTHENIKHADALIIRSIDKCSREILEGTNIRLITTATIGYDHIDTVFCDEAGISWKNAPGCNASSVGQYILNSLIYISLLKKEALAGKTIGIVGVGHVGKQIEKICSAYGLKILLNDPPRADKEGGNNFVSMETIAEKSDIISFHVPLSRKGEYPTYHLADQIFFNNVKRKPWIINAARGPVVDTNALLEAKRKGIISELIMDCWENEPDIDLELLKVSTIATPHIAGFSADGKSNATRTCLENIADFFEMDIPEIKNIQPAEPFSPFIDLNLFPENRIEHAILHTFNPGYIDGVLRKTPNRFEWFRAHYDHPREFPAYNVINSKPEEMAVLEKLGFSVK